MHTHINISESVSAGAATKTRNSIVSLKKRNDKDPRFQQNGCSSDIQLK